MHRGEIAHITINVRKHYLAKNLLLPFYFVNGQQTMTRWFCN